MQLRISVPHDLAEPIVERLMADEATSTLTVLPGSSKLPEGDLIIAEVARMGADDLITDLLAMKVHQRGSIVLQPMQSWVSRRGFEAEKARSGAGMDAIVWLEVTQRAYGESELNWTFLGFMTMATLIAGIAIILDSQILTVGAMVLGPEFGCIAALGVALVQKRWHLMAHAFRTLVLGFVVAMSITTLVTLGGRLTGWVTRAMVTENRSATAFIYHPDKWAFVVAIIAAAAGILSVTSAKTSGLSGVFISVTTIPAAGNVAIGVAMGVWSEVWGSLAQLAINIGCMTVSGCLFLYAERWLLGRFALRGWRERKARALERR